MFMSGDLVLPASQPVPPPPAQQQQQQQHQLSVSCSSPDDDSLLQAAARHFTVGLGAASSTPSTCAGHAPSPALQSSAVHSVFTHHSTDLPPQITEAW